MEALLVTEQSIGDAADGDARTFDGGSITRTMTGAEELGLAGAPFRVDVEKNASIASNVSGPAPFARSESTIVALGAKARPRR